MSASSRKSPLNYCLIHIVKQIYRIIETQKSERTTRNNRLPIPYLSSDVRYGTDGKRCVTIHLKLTDVSNKRPVTWHLNCGAAGSKANGTNP